MDDPQEGRARELELIGERRRAKRVRFCGQGTDELPYPNCGEATCPRCNTKRANRRMKQMAAAIRRMKHPVLVLVSLVTRDKEAETLKEAITTFNKRMTQLRHLKVFRSVVGGVGGLEAVVTNDKRGFNLHGHLVMDVKGKLDTREVNRWWKKKAKGRGSFLADPRRDERGDADDEDEEGELDQRSIGAVAKYATKPLTRSPHPRHQMHPEVLEAIWKGVKSRRLFLCWGTAKEPREARQAPAAKREGQLHQDTTTATITTPAPPPAQSVARVADHWWNRGFAAHARLEAATLVSEAPPACRPTTPVPPEPAGPAPGTACGPASTAPADPPGSSFAPVVAPLTWNGSEWEEEVF